MIQLAIEFQSMRIPDQGTQCGNLLRAFQRGERLTVAEALNGYGVFALSQRCGELRRSGWPVKSEWYTASSGARVKRYYMGAE